MGLGYVLLWLVLEITLCFLSQLCSVNIKKKKSWWIVEFNYSCPLLLIHDFVKKNE